VLRTFSPRLARKAHAPWEEHANSGEGDPTVHRAVSTVPPPPYPTLTQRKKPRFRPSQTEEERTAERAALSHTSRSRHLDALSVDLNGHSQCGFRPTLHTLSRVDVQCSPPLHTLSRSVAPLHTLSVGVHHWTGQYGTGGRDCCVLRKVEYQYCIYFVAILRGGNNTLKMDNTYRGSPSPPLSYPFIDHTEGDLGSIHSSIY
jgi:hypothetical protein